MPTSRDMEVSAAPEIENPAGAGLFSKKRFSKSGLADHRSQRVRQDIIIDIMKRDRDVPHILAVCFDVPAMTRFLASHDEAMSQKNLNEFSKGAL